VKINSMEIQNVTCDTDGRCWCHSSFKLTKWIVDKRGSTTTKRREMFTSDRIEAAQ
jgi:hypothetical protein